MSDAVRDLAHACAALLSDGAGGLSGETEIFTHAMNALVGALRDAGPRFAFDAEGRPGAIEAVRSALPASEAELLDAILEDVACESAARQEALYQIAAACRKPRR